MAQQRQQGKPQVARLPLMGAYSNRDSSGSKDQRFLNMFPETRKVEQLENTKIFINKRPGLSVYRDYGTGEGRNIAYFNGKFYVAVGNKVYEDAVSPVEKITLTASTGPVGMILANSSTTGDYLFVCDGTSAWVINSAGTATQISATGVYGVTLTSAGAGYGTAPSVSFSGGGGSGAAGTAVVTGGIITGVTITNAGSGYTSEPSVTFGAPVVTFNPTTTVNTSTNIISITNSYGIGSQVVYNNGGGGSIGGLTSGTTYYVIVVDGSQIKLANSLANAQASIEVDLTSVGSGTTHTLTGTTTATGTTSLNALPSPHIPVPTFIDGYIVLAKGSDVYTCDLDEPTKWSSENFLSAEMFPDAVVGLSRQNNQVVVYGASSTEFFYDAANASGSPLSRNDSTTMQMGNAAPYCTYANEQFCIFISQSESGGRAVFQVKGFQPNKISDEYIERILDAETDMSDVRGFGLRTKGHLFFVINLKTLGRTLVYDVDEKLWHEWSSNTNGSHTVFAYDFMADNLSGYAYLLHASNGTVYKLDPAVYLDDATTILCELITNKYDMDTYHRKFMHSIKLICDRYATANDVSLYWSDDDYQTWSNAKTIDLTDDFPAFHRLGSFRRRAFKLTHASNNPLRVESMECEFTEGAT